MEGLYLIHTREFITTEMPIYKIGRGDNVQIRVSQYPNGSNLLFLNICKNSKLCEKELIEIFKQKFIQEKYYGREYFSGDVYDMIDVMCNYIKLHNKKCITPTEKKQKVKLKVKSKVNAEVKDEIKDEIKINTEVNYKIKAEIKVNTEVKFEAKTEDKNIKFNNMCPKCLCNFKFVSVLKKHLQISSRCSMTKEEIDVYFTENKLSYKIYKNKDIISTKNIKNKELLQCVNCNTEFSRLDSLNRHKKTSNCNSTNTLFKLLTNINLNNTNTNITIQTINPFGYEDISQIPILEIKPILNNLLTSNIDVFSNVINIIYSKIENKNFYKPNLSKPELAILNTNFTITLYNYKDFIVILFDRCIILLQNMLYLCKNDFINFDIVTINNNIKNLVNNSKDICYKQIQIIIETEFRNNNINNKNNIKTFINKVKDKPDTKNTLLDSIKNILSFDEKSKEFINSINN